MGTLASWPPAISLATANSERKHSPAPFATACFATSTSSVKTAGSHDSPCARSQSSTALACVDPGSKTTSRSPARSAGRMASLFEGPDHAAVPHHRGEGPQLGHLQDCHLRSTHSNYPAL